MSKPHRSFTVKSRLEMVKLNLRQQLQVMEKFYPNYEGSIEMLKATIQSFEKVIQLMGGVA